MSVASKHRRNIAQLTDLARNDLRILFRRHTDAVKARDALLQSIPLMVSIYGSAAATLGANWYDDLRDASGVRGRFRGRCMGYTSPRFGTV